VQVVLSNPKRIAVTRQREALRRSGAQAQVAAAAGRFAALDHPNARVDDASAASAADLVALRPMVGPEIPEFVAASHDGYVADRVASGDDPVVAAGAADETIAAMFPDGEPRPGHLLYRIEEDGQPVRSLWIGAVSADQSR
jgi:hypothetical protein